MAHDQRGPPRVGGSSKEYLHVRCTGRRVVGAGVVGVTGLASVLATAPAALAAPAGVTPAVAPERPGPGAGAQVAAHQIASNQVAPNYGTQKYRVGVQVKDGAFVPEGTTTEGSQITVTETPADGSAPTTFSCSTEPGESDDAASTATYCRISSDLAPASVRPNLTQESGSSFDYPFDQLFTAPAGATITVTRKTVNANLVIDSETATIPPCETAVGDGVCFAGPAAKATSVTFDDAGLPPTASDDTASTTVDTAVDIAVLANDDTVVGAPVTGTAITTPPAHGTAVLTGADGADGGAQPQVAAAPPQSAAQVRYTPAAGFVGVDTFRYSFSTANGTASALVTVTVTGPGATTPTPGTTVTVAPTATGRNPQLAATGTDSGGLLLVGGALVAAGGAVTVLARRRGAHRA